MAIFLDFFAGMTGACDGHSGSWGGFRPPVLTSSLAKNSHVPVFRSRQVLGRLLLLKLAYCGD